MQLCHGGAGFLVGATCCSLVAGQPCATNASPCTDILLSISAEATHAVLPPFPKSTAAGVALQWLQSATSNPSNATQKVSGTFNISATYCEPVIRVQGREGTIQLLLHGLSVDKVKLFRLMQSIGEFKLTRADVLERIRLPYSGICWPILLVISRYIPRLRNSRH
jgi:hypothetical protein